ncbi:TPA_asm: IS3 family transposase [Listeria monocytogenes]|nr:IS3 family transposase [Listeria monocytogenes]HAC0982456.1 IS3 family transposase [Listeria monocytogenes]
MQYPFIHSQSRKGNPYAHAVMEFFYKSFKREILPGKQFHTKKQAILIIMDYLETYYNYKQIHSNLNCLTPHEFDTINEFA